MNAGDAARAAIELSKAVEEQLRAEAGPNGDVVALRAQIKRLFDTEAEQAEAHRLLDLAVWNRRSGKRESAQPEQMEIV